MHCIKEMYTMAVPDGGKIANVTACELSDVLVDCFVRSPSYGLGIGKLLEVPGDAVNVTVLVGTIISALDKWSDNHITSYCDHALSVYDHVKLSETSRKRLGASRLEIGTHVELEGIRTVIASM